jgi:hypothetical protein
MAVAPAANLALEYPARSPFELQKLAVENVKLVRTKRAYIRSHGMACGIMIADFCHSKLIHII